MKVFIVFLALAIINISMLVYDSDAQRYTELQTNLKNAASECSAGAALYYDQEEFAKGNMIFNREEGILFVEHFLEKEKKYITCKKEYTIEYNISYEENIENPAVITSLTMITEDLFRLPALEIKKIVRKSKYEFPEI